MEEAQFENLSDILLDPVADDAEKNEAAWLLSEYGDERGLLPLIQASLNPSENDISVMTDYGEAIAILWLKKGEVDLATYLKFSGKTRAGVCFTLDTRKPEWVKEYELDKYGFED
jgi:hypothetical protein